jgi:hypothetical protein
MKPRQAHVHKHTYIHTPAAAAPDPLVLSCWRPASVWSWTGAHPHAQSPYSAPQRSWVQAWLAQAAMAQIVPLLTSESCSGSRSALTRPISIPFAGARLDLHELRWHRHPITKQWKLSKKLSIGRHQSDPLAYPLPGPGLTCTSCDGMQVLS